MTRTQENESKVTLHEEELSLGSESRQAGVVRARKRVEIDDVEATAQRLVEEADITRVPANPNDSGEIEKLPDGTISIPLLEEELVIEKRLVVRERILVRKRQIVEETAVRDQLRREEIDIEREPGSGEDADPSTRKERR
jgi:uncharacterized protein (TIGR02271 family)